MTTTEAMDTALLRSLGLSWESAEIVLARINELKSDLEAAESRAAKAEAAVAEMRSVLLDSRKEHFGHRVSNGWFIARDRALMSDCGRGWVSPEKRREALELVKYLVSDRCELADYEYDLAAKAAAILKEDE